MDPEMVAALARLFGASEQIARLGETPVHALVAVFARVGAVVALLPGFGERTLPARVKLAAAVLFTLAIWPAALPLAQQAVAAARPGLADGAPIPLLRTLAAEAAVGLMLGIAVRLNIMALQLAGAIAAQATSVSQIAGAQVTPDPMPALGALLVVAGVALAMHLGLHVKAAALLARSYAVAPLGAFPPAADVGEWGAARAGQAFDLAVSLAAPFVVASFAYNLALGAINRAMPQLMVAFVGAPAITAGALILLWICAPALLAHWHGRLDAALADPFGTP
ncbi:MAG: flagellar biosynthetic protein FliR [Pseudomonadota bacterium]|nr:flagellar biosynthetic protein FliR [Pseudomonadota bacterium]